MLLVAVDMLNESATMQNVEHLSAIAYPKYGELVIRHPKEFPLKVDPLLAAIMGSSLGVCLLAVRRWKSIFSSRPEHAIDLIDEHLGIHILIQEEYICAPLAKRVDLVLLTFFVITYPLTIANEPVRGKGNQRLIRRTIFKSFDGEN